MFSFPRVLAWHCFGKLALLPGLGADLASLCLVPKALEVLRSVENPRVQEAAAAALLDAAQVFGTLCLDGLAILGQELQHMVGMSVHQGYRVFEPLFDVNV